MKFITHKDASSFLVAVLFLEPGHLMVLKVRISIGFGATKLIVKVLIGIAYSPPRDGFGAHQHGQSQRRQVQCTLSHIQCYWASAR